jgi:hypothetical protein
LASLTSMAGYSFGLIASEHIVVGMGLWAWGP